ncbi:sensor histidine kinase [Verticiella sediminum]|uniref:histidine kinase n=1 Tax=Verticiella sediminum TaxID=1247510 RepID=A0A556AIG1_9BURK|nr:sensor histidine kinase [Verticiella sediminum]TSH92661.1 sensor histidine kinase [Verticiella sediminum]
MTPSGSAQRPFARVSVRRRLLATLLVLFVAGTAVLALMLRGYARQAADASYDQLLQASALSMADSLQLVQGRWQMDMPYAALELLAQAPRDRVFYRVTDLDGAPIAGYGDAPAPPRAPGPAGPVYFDAVYRGEPVRFAALQRQLAGPEQTTAAVVQVGQTRLAREALAADIVWRGSLALLAFAATVIAVAWWGVHRALAPVARVERDLAAREAADLRPLGTPVPAELEHLVRALDDFMARLADNQDALRLFIAEAAHQLRTPLAALRAQLQLALEDDDPAERQRSLQAVQRNAERLSRLVNQLLSDASVNHRGALRQYESVELAAVLRQAVHDSVPMAEPRPDVRLALPDTSACIRGDALMLREAVKNLIDNALRHGDPAAGPIEVSLQREGESWCIVVADRGPGIAPAFAQTAFERFSRGPQARADGAGLGLAIVRRAVEGQGGTVTLANRAGGGLAVTLRLAESHGHAS